MHDPVLSPIALFVYNRVDRAEKVLGALSANRLAQESELYVFCDGPKTQVGSDEQEAVIKTREYVRETEGFKRIHIIENERNLGLDHSIMAGIDQVLGKHNSVIVLEDDIHTSSGFLEYMNNALQTYADDERVMNVSGFWFPAKGSENLPETFFLSSGGNWGWATWKRAWKRFSAEVEPVIDGLSKNEQALRSFSFDQTSLHFDQLLKNREPDQFTWDIFWHASIILNGGLTLFPNKSLVNNLGMDGSGTHIEHTDHYHWNNLADRVAVARHRLEPSQQAFELLCRFFRETTMQPSWRDKALRSWRFIINKKIRWAS